MVAGCAIALAATWSTDARAQAAGQWKDDQQIYVKICSNCHETGVGPVIKARPLATNDDRLPPEYFEFTVRNGKLAMPAFRVTDINDAELRKLAEVLSASQVVTPTTGGAK